MSVSIEDSLTATTAVPSGAGTGEMNTPPRPGANRSALVQEVTSVVHEHIDRSMVATVNAAWEKGQHMFQRLQQQSADQGAHLEQQLAHCLSSQQQIHRDNEQLRQAISALMQQLDSITSPGTASAYRATSPAVEASQASSLAAVAAQAVAVAKAQIQDSSPVVPIDSQTTPSAEPQNVSIQPDSKSVPEEAGDTSFNMTLRRADDVPVGLELSVSDDGQHLIVEAVRPGGAVDSWNRQCSGDLRQIRQGDRLARINGVEGACAMLAQCRDKHLLKLFIERHVGERTVPAA